MRCDAMQFQLVNGARRETETEVDPILRTSETHLTRYSKTQAPLSDLDREPRGGEDRKKHSDPILYPTHGVLVFSLVFCQITQGRFI